MTKRALHKLNDVERFWLPALSHAEWSAAYRAALDALPEKERETVKRNLTNLIENLQIIKAKRNERATANGYFRVVLLRPGTIRAKIIA